MAIAYRSPSPARGIQVVRVAWGRALGRLARWPWDRLRQHLARHRTRSLLDMLDERTLKDIGLTRMDLRYLGRKGNRHRI